MKKVEHVNKIWEDKKLCAYLIMTAISVVALISVDVFVN